MEHIVLEGNDEELSTLATFFLGIQAKPIFNKTTDICGVHRIECIIDFIENVNWSWMEDKKRENECQCKEGTENNEIKQIKKEMDRRKMQNRCPPLSSERESFQTDPKATLISRPY